MHKDQAQRLLDTAVGIIIAEGFAITFPERDSCLCAWPSTLVVKSMKDGWPDLDESASEWEWVAVRKQAR